LAAREEIRDLIARYNQFGDHARFEDMAELFTEDATLEVDGRDPINGRNEIRDFLAGVRDSGVAGRAEQGKPPTYVRHHTSTVVIDLESPPRRVAPVTSSSSPTSGPTTGAGTATATCSRVAGGGSPTGERAPTGRFPGRGASTGTGPDPPTVDRFVRFA